MFAYCNIKARSRNHYCRRKAVSITYPDRVFAPLVIQHAQRMSRITLSYMACPVLPCFSKLSLKWHDFRKKITEHKMCVSIFSTNFARNISHAKNNSARYCQNVHRSSGKLLVILLRL